MVLKMALLQQWREVAYNEELGRDKLQQFWGMYFQKEKEIYQKRGQVLTLVGMDTKGYKMPHELSGGEQQRICIARALLNDPKLILADEPTGNLDPDTGKQIMEILRKVSNSGTTILMITHNLQWIQEYPGRVFRCENRKLIVEDNNQ